MSHHDDRFIVIEAGFTGDEDTARRFLDHTDGHIRASALRSLARMHSLTHTDIISALVDNDAEVRRTAVECAVEYEDVPVHQLLDDPDVFVAEMTAWCLGERNATTDEIDALIAATTGHPEAVVREASAAALGSIGNDRGLDAILQACTDKATVRRRAVLALAPFDDPRVDAALAIALEDRDWQVRQNAEILTSPRERVSE